ncbi:hypothetical protein IMG5_191380, partial [Ichthyophthirius multifiliis]
KQKPQKSQEQQNTSENLQEQKKKESQNKQQQSQQKRFQFNFKEESQNKPQSQKQFETQKYQKNKDFVQQQSQYSQKYQKPSYQSQNQQQQLSQQQQNPQQYQQYQNKSQQQRKYDDRSSQDVQEGFFLKEFYKEHKESPQESQTKGINSHQVIDQRIQRAQQYSNPNEYTLKILIESYALKHEYDKALESYNLYKTKKFKSNESLKNTIFESLCKTDEKMEKINEFFIQEFSLKKQQKLLYKSNIINYFKKLKQFPLQEQIKNLKFFVSQFEKHSFFQIDLTFMYELFQLANISQFNALSDILADLMALSSPSENYQLTISQKLNKESLNHLKQMQFEALNCKGILNQLLNNGFYDSFSKLIYAMNNLGLFEQQEHAQKLVSFEDLITFSLKSQQPVFFWVDIIGKIIDFNKKTDYLQYQLTKNIIQDPQIIQKSFQKNDLDEFFTNLHLI